MRFTRPSGSETAGWRPDASGRFFRDPQQKNPRTWTPGPRYACFIPVDGIGQRLLAAGPGFEKLV